MNLSNIRLFKEKRFAIKEDLDTGKYYLSFPVFNGYIDDIELYEILPHELPLLLNDELALLALLEKSRNRLNDDRLIGKPGRHRGSPC